MTRIVVLDGHTLNPGDNPWSPVASHGQLTVHPRTDPDDSDLIRERARGAEILLTNKTPLSGDTIETLPQLAFIGVLATGYDVVDISAASKRDIVVCNVPEYGTEAVAEHVFALLFGLCRHVWEHDAAIRDGAWARSGDFTFQLTPQRGLVGMTLGIVGFGRIGRAVAERALAFGMNVVAHSHSPFQHDRVAAADLPQLLADSDVVSLHCPATPDTIGMLNRDRLAMMKAGAILINTARGSLIDEAALAESLTSGHLAGAALDVVSNEPIEPANPVLQAPNCLLTPHMAWATLTARRRLMEIMGDNIAAFRAGQPIHWVNSGE